MWELILIGVLTALLYWYLHSSQYPANFPPGPRHVLPFIGDPFCVIGQDVTAGYEKMHQKYGKIVGFNFAGKLFVSINDLGIIQKLYNSEDFVNRPHQDGMNCYRQGAVSGNFTPGIIFNNGESWKNLRRFTLRTLRDFGFGKQTMAEMIQDEFSYLSRALEDTKGEPVDTHTVFNFPVLNALWRILAGERFEDGNVKLKKTIDAMDQLFAESGSVLGFLAFSSRKFIPIFEGLGLIQITKAVNLVFDVADEEIAKHEATYDKDYMRDMTDCYLFQKMPGYSQIVKEDKFAKQNLRNIYLDLFFAGSETTSSTLKWGLLYTVLNPEIQQKLQKEVDNVTMNNSWSTLNELRSKMPYTEAVLLEVQRIGNIVPGALLHSNTKTIHIENYTLPPGTSVNFQMSGALKDSIVFPSPDEFIPERFIDAKGLFVPHPSVVPFGVGKRKCLGESLAKMELFIFFAGIINKFEIKLANENEIPSTAYRPGITLSPFPFKLRFIARK